MKPLDLFKSQLSKTTILPIVTKILLVHGTHIHLLIFELINLIKIRFHHLYRLILLFYITSLSIVLFNVFIYKKIRYIISITH